MEKTETTHDLPEASNTGVSRATRLEEATFSASHYISSDLKSQAEKVHTIWSALEQASSALVDPETLSDPDLNVSIRSAM